MAACRCRAATDAGNRLAQCPISGDREHPWTFGCLSAGLDEAGYVEGRNVAIEYRWAEGHNDRLPALTADLVARQVSVIAAVSGAPAAFAAKAATTTIPIVFYVGDPVQLGFVASLNRPGSNMTGVAIMSAELIGKRLDLLRELVPAAAVIAVLVNPANTGTTELETRNLKDAAQALGLGLRFLHASSANEIDAALHHRSRQPMRNTGRRGRRFPSASPLRRNGVPSGGESRVACRRALSGVPIRMARAPEQLFLWRTRGQVREASPDLRY
jgi:ABC transporter substrate binding protein